MGVANPGPLSHAPRDYIPYSADVTLVLHSSAARPGDSQQHKPNLCTGPSMRSSFHLHNPTHAIHHTSIC